MGSMSPTRDDRDFPGDGIRETVHPLQYGKGWPAYTSPEQSMYLLYREQGFSPDVARQMVAGGTDTSAVDVSDEPPPSDELAEAYETSQNWRAVWRFARQGGQLVVRSVTLEPVGSATPDGGITSAVLRELSPPRAIQEAAAGLEEFAAPGTFGELLLRWRTEAVQAYERTLPSGPKGGRPRLSDEHLRAVALAYLEELNRGRGLLKRIGERFEVSEGTVRGWVHLARKAGFLAPAQQGKRGSGPGPRLAEEISAPAE